MPFKTMAMVSAAAMLALASSAQAQEAVVKAKDVEALFTSRNPALHRNKQVAYHIMKDLLEAGRWDEADKWLTARYIQHNPNVASGRDTVVRFFKSIGAVAKPSPKKLGAPVVSVTAEGDMVVVATVQTLPDPRAPGKTYTTTWYDSWRMVDGKADEHWDSSPVFVPSAK